MRIEGHLRGPTIATALLHVLEGMACESGCNLVVTAPESGEAFAAFVGGRKWSLTNMQFEAALDDRAYSEVIARFRVWLKAGDGPFVGVAGKPRSKLSSRSPCRR